jgi:hypothetical protein
MMGLFSLVGRAGFEPATNGLKVRYAVSARRAFRGEAASHGPLGSPFWPVLWRNLPSFRRLVLELETALDENTACRSAGPLRHWQSPRSCVSRLNRQQWSRTGNAAARAFAFLGRCFVVVRRGDQTRYSEQEGVSYPEPQANALRSNGSYRPTGALPPAGPRGGSRIETAGVAPGHHHKAPSSSGRASTQQTGLYRPHPRKTADSVTSPVLTPHAQVAKAKGIYRGPERGTNPPDFFGCLVAGAVARRVGPSWRTTAQVATVGAPTTRKALKTGHRPLVKVPGTANPPAVRVGRFYGVGVARPENTQGSPAH